MLTIEVKKKNRQKMEKYARINSGLVFCKIPYFGPKKVKNDKISWFRSQRSTFHAGRSIEVYRSMEKSPKK